MPGRTRPKRAGAQARLPAVVPISAEQYQKGGDLYLTGATFGEIVALTGMTRAQIEQLRWRGEPDRGWVSWEALRAERVAALRASAQEAAKHVSDAGLAGLREMAVLSKEAGKMLRAIIGTHQNVMADVINKAKEKGETDERLLEDLAMPKALRETTKILAHLADPGRLGEAARKLYDTPNARMDLSGISPKEASQVPPEHRPAALTSGEGGSDDPLTELLPPGGEHWTPEEIEIWATTGVMPARVYRGGTVIDVSAEDAEDPEA